MWKRSIAVRSPEDVVSTYSAKGSGDLLYTCLLIWSGIYDAKRLTIWLAMLYTFNSYILLDEEDVPGCSGEVQPNGTAPQLGRNEEKSYIQLP